MSGNFSRGPADDAADCSGSDAASTAAAAAANLALLQLPRLPVDILSIIASHAPNDARGQLRLCSKHFAGAVDPLVRSLTFKAWPGPLFTTRKRLRHVTALHLQFSIPDSGATSTPRNSMAGNPSQCSTDTCTGTSVNNLPWDRLTAMIQQLPHLTSLGLPLWDLELPLRPRLPVTYTEHLTRLTRLDLEDTGLLPVGLQLPGLRAASLLSNEVPASLTAIAAFAPNLQQLGCRRLELMLHLTAEAAAADVTQAQNAGHMPVAAPDDVDQADEAQEDQLAAIAVQNAAVGEVAIQAAAAALAVLPHVTHFGGQVVTVVGAMSPEQAAAAFGHVFPNMKVLFRVPQVSDVTGKECGYEHLLTHLPQLTAIRGRNWFSSRSWFLIRSSGHLASNAWSNIRYLSFHSNSYPDGCSDFLDISKSSQLQHLRLTFNYPYTKADELVRELAALPSLNSLSLPAALFCSRCCPERHYPGLRHSLEALVVKPQLTRLDLLTLPEATVGNSYSCGHITAVKEYMEALSTTAHAARAQHLQQLHQQQSNHQQHQQQQQLKALQLVYKVEDPSWSDDSYFSRKFEGHGTWGVYVDANEC